MSTKAVLLDELRALSEDEIYARLYSDYLTGVGNRAAFDADDRRFVTIVDLDSLKYVNDTLGHRMGDYQLNHLACALVEEFGHDNVYRLSGDEFAIKSANLAEVGAFSRVRSVFPGFSYGQAMNLVDADIRLQQSKNIREAQGQRAPRGECPPWIGMLKNVNRQDAV